MSGLCKKTLHDFLSMCTSDRTAVKNGGDHSDIRELDTAPKKIKDPERKKESFANPSSPPSSAFTDRLNTDSAKGCRAIMGDADKVIDVC